MTEYKALASEFERAGVNVVAISSDAPEKSAALARDLGLPFRLLSDPERKLIRDWALLNTIENVAKPATFVIDRQLKVRFASTESVYSRTGTPDVLQFVQEMSRQSTSPEQPHRRFKLPAPANCVRAVRNWIRYGRR